MVCNVQTVTRKRLHGNALCLPVHIKWALFNKSNVVVTHKASCCKTCIFKLESGLHSNIHSSVPRELIRSRRILKSKWWSQLQSRFKITEKYYAKHRKLATKPKKRSLDKFRILSRQKWQHSKILGTKAGAATYAKKKQLSVQYCAEENWRTIDKALLNYWKLRNAQIYSLTGVSRTQIMHMSACCNVEEDRMFQYWYYFKTNTSDRKLATLFGTSAKYVRNLRNKLEPILSQWGYSTVINDRPEHEQAWTTRRIRQETTDACWDTFEDIFDIREPRTIIIMDGSYVFTERPQTEYTLSKKMYSGYKKLNLAKPHISCTSTGKIVHIATFFADGMHSDKHIYRWMTDPEYLEYCKANIDDPEKCTMTRSQIKELEYLHKIWTMRRGLALTDNGYYTHWDSRLQTPRSVKGRGPTICANQKRQVTMHRHVTERINASLKRWGVLNTRQVNAYQISRIHTWCLIAAGFHNIFGATMQKNTPEASTKVDRWKQMRCILENPLDRYYEPTAQSHDSDDEGEFEFMYSNEKAIRTYFRHQEWLKDLNITKEDLQDLVGMQFQARLTKSYIRSMTSALTLELHSECTYLYRFSNIVSRYMKSETRTVMLNFGELIDYRKQIQKRKDNSATMIQTTEPSESNSSAANQIQYIEKLQTSSWYDIDWSAWETDLVRLQYHCSCNAGAQLVNPCAHVCAMIYYIWHIINGTLDIVRAARPRDMKINQNITDITNAVTKFQSYDKRDKRNAKKKKKKNKIICICRQYIPDQEAYKCIGCDHYYHASCVQFTEQEAKARARINQFTCGYCTPFNIYCRTYAPIPKVFGTKVGDVPGLEDLSSNDDEMNDSIDSNAHNHN